MATATDCNIRPVPSGYQTFTIELTDEDAALLRAETRAQEAYHRAWSEQNGFPVRIWTPDKLASTLVSIALRKEGGAQ
ncbi:MAG: hypothetical protein WCF99_06005 [Chloroflexales bacterium]